MYDHRLDHLVSLEFSSVARQARLDGKKLISLGLESLIGKPLKSSQRN